ncbi:MAG TPA: M48 family metalloprotease [Blastocatellia bacterium]|nr:M48 family metalloprotease [Blastocatellia bacterium]
MSPLARRSAIVLGLLFGLVFAVGVGLMWYLDQPVYYAIIFAVVVTLVQYAAGPVIIDYIFTIRWTSPDSITPEFGRWYFDTCTSQRITAPRFGIIDDGNPNAFTYGRTRGDARLVVTSGLVGMLSPEELRAVVAHEIGHVANRDFVVMTIAQALPLVLYILYVWTRRGRNVSYATIVSIGAFAVYIFSQYVVLSLSRVRELFADDRSARITSDPTSLSSALVKISYGISRNQEADARLRQTTEDGKKHGKKAEKQREWLPTMGVTALGIANTKGASGFAIAAADATGAFSARAMANAMRWELENPWARWFQLGSTHPLTARRIMAMNDAARRLGRSPFGSITLEQSDLVSYTGNFARELAIYLLPVLGAIAGFGFGLLTIDFERLLRLEMAGLAGFGIGLLVKTALVYPRLPGSFRTVEQLVAQEINASHVNPVPCTVEGEIIGRGVPGLFFSDDLVLRDGTGFIRLQYRQPLGFLEFLFGWLKAGHYVNHRARVNGWYRRAPFPYIEISDVRIIDGTLGNVRCYYRWGLYAVALGAIVIGLALCL